MVGKMTEHKKKHLKYHISRKIAYKYLRKFTILCTLFPEWFTTSKKYDKYITEMSETEFDSYLIKAILYVFQAKR